MNAAADCIDASPFRVLPGGLTITAVPNSWYFPRSPSWYRTSISITTARPGRSSNTFSPL
jgi:hypothetical protein